MKKKDILVKRLKRVNPQLEINLRDLFKNAESGWHIHSKYYYIKGVKVQPSSECQYAQHCFLFQHQHHRRTFLQNTCTDQRKVVVNLMLGGVGCFCWSADCWCICRGDESFVSIDMIRSTIWKQYPGVYTKLRKIYAFFRNRAHPH